MKMDLNHALGCQGDGGVDLVLEPGSTGCKTATAQVSSFEIWADPPPWRTLTLVPNDPVHDDMLGLQFTPDTPSTEVMQDGHDETGSAPTGYEDGDVVSRQVRTGSIRSVEQDGRGGGFELGETGADPALDVGLEDDDHFAFVRLKSVPKSAIRRGLYGSTMIECTLT